MTIRWDAMRDLPEDLCALIRKHEGFRKLVYRDSEGKLTIGYGTLLENGLSRDEAELLMRFRMVQMLEEISPTPEGRVMAELPDDVMHAMSSMLYNLGTSRLRKFKRMFTALSLGNWNQAALEALDSKWARQVKSRARETADAIRRVRRA